MLMVRSGFVTEHTLYMFDLLYSVEDMAQIITQQREVFKQVFIHNINNMSSYNIWVNVDDDS